MTDKPATATPAPPRAQRADAQRNRARILDVARTVVAEQGTQASLRDIARRAGVGLGTLYRHFPTREDLLEALLSQGFDRLAARAAELEASHQPEEALVEWLGDFADSATSCRGLAASMVATLDDESSSLHASCLAMRQAGARLLENAKTTGRIRPDVTGTDLYALVNAVSWVAEQTPSIAARREHLLSLVIGGLRHHPK